MTFSKIFVYVITSIKKLRLNNIYYISNKTVGLGQIKYTSDIESNRCS